MDTNLIAAVIAGIIAGIGAVLEVRRKDGGRVDRRLERYREQSSLQEPFVSLAGIPFGQVFEAQVLATRLLNTVYEKSVVMEKRQADMEKRLIEMEADNKRKDQTIQTQNETIARHEKRIKKLESLLEEKGIPVPPDTDELKPIIGTVVNEQ